MMFRVKPMYSMAANVAISELGIATAAMSVSRTS